MASKEEAEYVSPYWNGKPPVVNMPELFNYDFFKCVNDAFDRVTGPIWAMNTPGATPGGGYPNNGADITFKSLQETFAKLKESGTPNRFGIPVKFHDWLPPDTIMLVDSKGTIHKVINIGNADHREKDYGWCVGEMR
jgi:hypothetical protein